MAFKKTIHHQNFDTIDNVFALFRYEDGAFDNDTVKSCVSVTAWPPIFYKNYTALLDRYARHILRTTQHTAHTSPHRMPHDATTQDWRGDRTDATLLVP